MARGRLTERERIARTLRICRRRWTESLTLSASCVLLSPRCVSQSYPSSRPPVPYLSKPEDRALYRIDDDEEAAWSANGSPPATHPINLHATAVPHYSYRPPPETQVPPAAESQPQRAPSSPHSTLAASANLTAAVHSSAAADADGSDEKHQPIDSGSESDPSELDDSSAVSDQDDTDAVIVTHNAHSHPHAQSHSPHKHKHKHGREHGKQLHHSGQQVPHPLQPTK